MATSPETVTLTPDFQRFADEQVRAGRYEDVGAVAREAFLRLQQWDIVVEESDVPGLMAALEDAREDVRRGRYEEGSAEELMADIQAGQRSERRARRGADVRSGGPAVLDLLPTQVAEAWSTATAGAATETPAAHGRRSREKPRARRRPPR